MEQFKVAKVMNIFDIKQVLTTYYYDFFKNQSDLYREMWSTLLLPKDLIFSSVSLEIINNKLLITLFYKEQGILNKVAYAFDEFGMKYALDLENRVNGFRIYKMNEELFLNMINDWKKKSKLFIYLNQDNVKKYYKQLIKKESNSLILPNEIYTFFNSLISDYEHKDTYIKQCNLVKSA